MDTYVATQEFRVGSQRFKKGDVVTGVALQSLRTNKMMAYVTKSGAKKGEA